MSMEDRLSANSLVPAVPREVAVTASHLVQRGFQLAVSELNPRLVEAYYDRGRNRALWRDYYQAIQDFTKVIELDTSYAILHKVYRECGNAANMNRLFKISPTLSRQIREIGVPISGGQVPMKVYRNTKDPFRI